MQERLGCQFGLVDLSGQWRNHCTGSRGSRSQDGLHGDILCVWFHQMYPLVYAHRQLHPNFPNLCQYNELQLEHVLD